MNFTFYGSYITRLPFSFTIFIETHKQMFQQSMNINVARRFQWVLFSATVKPVLNGH